MQCPECGATHIRKNGKRKGKQNHICVACSRQLIDAYDPHRGYSDEVRRDCLKLYTNGLGFQSIVRVKGVHHTTAILWVMQVGERLPDTYDPDPTPEVGELDELETFVGAKSGATPRRFPALGKAHQDKQDLAVGSRRPLQTEDFRLGARVQYCCRVTDCLSS